MPDVIGHVTKISFIASNHYSETYSNIGIQVAHVSCTFHWGGGWTHLSATLNYWPFIWYLT